MNIFINGLIKLSRINLYNTIYVMKRTSFFQQLILLIISIFTNISLQSQNAPITTAGTATACPGNTVTVQVTVNNFTSITAVSLRIEYDPVVMTFNSSLSSVNSLLAGAIITNYPVGGGSTLYKIIISWGDVTPKTFAYGTVLATLGFNYINGSSSLAFNNIANYGQDCEYADQNGNPLNDLPTSTYYINGQVSSAAAGTSGSISGPTNVAQGTTGVIYSISPILNATGYVWTVPSGGTIVAGTNTNVITVDFSISSSSGNITVYATSLCGNGNTSVLPVSIVKEVDLILFLEGLFYSSTGNMNKAQDISGDRYLGSIADKITFQIAQSTNPYAIQYTVNNVDLNQNGSAIIYLPTTYSGSYYLIVKHRNSMETWSASPISFSTGTISFNFSTSASQAYGNNLKNIADKWVIFGGDANQEGIIDAANLITVDNAKHNNATGYISEDINGDGIVNSADLILTETNASLFVRKSTPP
jgi:hypothetical protein